LNKKTEWCYPKITKEKKKKKRRETQNQTQKKRRKKTKKKKKKKKKKKSKKGKAVDSNTVIKARDADERKKPGVNRLENKAQKQPPTTWGGWRANIVDTQIKPQR